MYVVHGCVYQAVRESPAPTCGSMCSLGTLCAGSEKLPSRPWASRTSTTSLKRKTLLSTSVNDQMSREAELCGFKGRLIFFIFWQLVSRLLLSWAPCLDFSWVPIVLNFTLTLDMLILVSMTVCPSTFSEHVLVINMRNCTKII